MNQKSSFFIFIKKWKQLKIIKIAFFVLPTVQNQKMFASISWKQIFFFSICPKKKILNLTVTVVNTFHKVLRFDSPFQMQCKNLVRYSADSTVQFWLSLQLRGEQFPSVPLSMPRWPARLLTNQLWLGYLLPNQPYSYWLIRPIPLLQGSRGTGSHSKRALITALKLSSW